MTLLRTALIAGCLLQTLDCLAQESTVVPSPTGPSRTHGIAKKPLAPSTPGSITFDEYPVNTPIADQYKSKGVTFSGGYIELDNYPDVLYLSADNESYPDPYGNGANAGAITAFFSSPTAFVEADAIYLDQESTMTVVAFDANGAELARTTGTGRLRVEAAGIAKAVFSFFNPVKIDDIAGIDNLAFSPSDQCAQLGGQSEFDIRESRAIRATRLAIDSPFRDRATYERTRQLIQLCGPSDEPNSAAECLQPGTPRNTLVQYRAAQDHLLQVMRTQGLGSVVGAERFGYDENAFPLVVQFHAAVGYYGAVDTEHRATDATADNPRAVCGSYANPLPASAAPWLTCKNIADPNAALIAADFHSTYGIQGGGWTRAQTYSPSVCGTGSYRDHAYVLDSTQSVRLQDYEGFTPRGEPNPELGSYSWPYWNWPFYVKWWHDTY